MQIIFLGTGTSQGVPVIACHCPVCGSSDFRDKRLRSSILIHLGDKRIVVDCGPDFRQQMLREKTDRIDAILVTHGHKDHIGGLDDVRAFNYILQRPTDVYVGQPAYGVIQREFSYAFEKNPYPGVPEINLIEFRNEPFQVQDISVIPIMAYHFNRDQYVYGFRIQDFTYLTDAVHIPEHEKQKIYGSKVLVLNALRIKKHYSHFNLEEALTLMKEFNPERGYLTHISHQMGKHEEVNARLPVNVQLAYDGLNITV